MWIQIDHLNINMDWVAEIRRKMTSEGLEVYLYYVNDTQPRMLAGSTAERFLAAWEAQKGEVVYTA